MLLFGEAMQRLIEPYPYSPTESLTEILHGVPVVDSYRWLEDQNSVRTRKWLEDQAAYARSYLDALPGREQITNRIRELLSIDIIDVPQKVGNRIFFLKHGPNFEQPVIMMREGFDGHDISLVDPSSHFQGTSHSVDILSVSKDARLLAFSVRRGGEDFQAIRIFNTDTKEILADSLPRGRCNGFVFSDDCSGFFYSHDAIETPRSCRSAYWHTLGTSPAEDSEVFTAGQDPKLRLVVVGSAGARYVGFLVSRIDATRTHDLYVRPKRRHSLPQLVLAGIRGRLIPRFSENFLVCLILPGRDNGRIIAMDLGHLGIADGRTVVPESNARIHDFAVVGRTAFVRYVENTESRVEMIDITGQPQGALPAPTQGTTRLFPCDPEGDAIFYRFSSFLQPPTIYCYQPRTRVNQLWSSQQIPLDTSSLVVSQMHSVSSDGTQIPVYLVRHKRFAHSRSLPTLLTAYGGFGNSITPEFSIFGSLLAENGCLFAVASVRGGSEFGEQWHEAAKRHNRQTSIDDFLAASEWLVQKGHASPVRLAIAGGSNGGLLVAAATTQRPELFRAALCLGPLLDMLRYHQFDAARNWIEEFGSADNPQDFPFLLAYSPYHRVRDNTPYPAMMFVSGDSDSRCNPMHVRKMTARLQAATVSGHPIILDYRSKCGHMPTQPLETRIELMTDRVSFICCELEIQT